MKDKMTITKEDVGVVKAEDLTGADNDNKDEIKLPNIGEMIEYVDEVGVSHNALVLHSGKNWVNIVYVNPDKVDSSGNMTVKQTSVPIFDGEMDGFYVIL